MKSTPFLFSPLVVALWCVAGLLLATTAYAQNDAAEEPDEPEIAYTEGPTLGAIGDVAEINVGSSYLFFGREATAQLMEKMQNPLSGQELATVMHNSGEWFVVFEFADIGYVADDEKDELDTDAMLESIQEGSRQSNEERRRRGWAEYYVVGWRDAPHYDSNTNNLSWTIEGASEGNTNFNRTVKILGRGGVMTAILVSGPDTMNEASVAATYLLEEFNYLDGNRYAEFVPGTDKLAEYGLTALVVGGAGAALLKTGLLAKLWKPIAAALVALGAGIKSVFGGGRSSNNDPGNPIG